MELLTNNMADELSGAVMEDREDIPMANSSEVVTAAIVNTDHNVGSGMDSPSVAPPAHGGSAASPDERASVASPDERASAASPDGRASVGSPEALGPPVAAPAHGGSASSPDERASVASPDERASIRFSAQGPSVTAQAGKASVASPRALGPPVAAPAHGGSASSPDERASVASPDERASIRFSAQGPSVTAQAGKASVASPRALGPSATAPAGAAFVASSDERASVASSAHWNSVASPEAHGRSVESQVQEASVAYPAHGASVAWSAQEASVATDSDSDDYNITVAIRKQARLKRSENQPAFRPALATAPLAFRTVIPIDPSSLPNFLNPQKSKKSSHEEDVNKTVDKAKATDKPESGSFTSTAHETYSNSTRPGGSRKRPLVLDDSDDEGDSAHTSRKAKRPKMGEGSRKPHSKDNPKALGDSTKHKHRKSSKSRHGSERKESKRHRTRHHHHQETTLAPFSDTGMPWEVSQASQGTKRAAHSSKPEEKKRDKQRDKQRDEPKAHKSSQRAEPAAAKADTRAKPKDAPHTENTANSTGAASRQTTERAWAAAQKSAPFANTTTQRTPISTIIAPIPLPRPATTRPIPAPSNIALGPSPNTQDKEELVRKRQEDKKKKEEEIAARKQTREAEQKKNSSKEDADVYQTFAAKVPEVPKTRIVDNLPSNNFQRPETGRRPAASRANNRGSINIFQAPPRSQPTARRAYGRGIAPVPPRGPSIPSRHWDSYYEHGIFPASPTHQTNHQHNGPYHQPSPPQLRYNQPQTAHPRQHRQALPPAPTPARIPRRPIDTIPALTALGEDRIIHQFVVYRTMSFRPQGVETRDHHKVRCLPEYVQSSAANGQAHAHFDRSKKGVVGKSFKHVTSKSGASLFAGVVTFDDGRVQHTWVEEEMQSLKKAVRDREGGLMLDRERVPVLVRKRFDVVSVYIVGVGPEEDSEEEVMEEEEVDDVVIGQGGEEASGDDSSTEDGSEDEDGTMIPSGEVLGKEHAGKDGCDEKMKEVLQRKGMQSQVLVVDCGGEEDDCAANGVAGMADAENECGKTTKDGDEKADGDSAPTPLSTASTSVEPIDRPTNITTATARPKPHNCRETESIVNFHGTYTTLGLAKREAFKTFISLAKPNPTHSREARHFFIHYVKPLYTEAVKENMEQPGEFVLEWDPPREYKWGFRRLVVRVVESELKGPVDISDMVVGAQDGAPGAGVSTAKTAKNPVPSNPATTSSVRENQDQTTLASRPSTPPQPGAQREPAAVASIPAPENPTPSQPAAPMGFRRPLLAETRAPLLTMGDDESEVSEEE